MIATTKKSDKNKELEDKILEFIKTETYRVYLEPSHGYRGADAVVGIRDIYVGVNAGSYGACNIFNSVLAAMGKAQMINVQDLYVSLSRDLNVEIYRKAQEYLAAQVGAA